MHELVRDALEYVAYSLPCYKGKSILALLGTALVWFPVLATIVTGLFVTIRSHMLRIDYLMPAELFPAALGGGALLLWAALLAHSRRGIIGWGFVAAIGMLVGGQALAVASGLASGAAEPAGWPWALVITSLAAYVLALLVLDVGALLLLRDLFRRAKPAASQPRP
jgi:hypothetical protein